MGHVYFEGGFKDKEEFFHIAKSYEIKFDNAIEKVELRRWCEEKCKGAVYILTRTPGNGVMTICFEDENDAAFFRLNH